MGGNLLAGSAWWVWGLLAFGSSGLYIVLARLGSPRPGAAVSRPVAVAALVSLLCCVLGMGMLFLLVAHCLLRFWLP